MQFYKKKDFFKLIIDALFTLVRDRLLVLNLRSAYIQLDVPQFVRHRVLIFSTNCRCILSFLITNIRIHRSRIESIIDAVRHRVARQK